MTFHSNISRSTEVPQVKPVSLAPAPWDAPKPVEVTPTLEDRIVAYIGEMPHACLASVISKQFAITPNQARMKLADMAREGVLSRTDPNGSKGALYTLAGDA